LAVRVWSHFTLNSAVLGLASLSCGRHGARCSAVRHDHPLEGGNCPP
jgi:hypothetical protein